MGRPWGIDFYKSGIPRPRNKCCEYGTTDRWWIVDR